MKYLILTLIIIIIVLIKVIVYLKNEKDIQYSNYQNCLKALKIYDQKMVEYLERKGK